jgi:hypothetical protein
MNSKGREKLDHRVGPTGFKVNTEVLNLNKKDMLHEAKPSDVYSSVIWTGLHIFSHMVFAIVHTCSVLVFGYCSVRPVCTEPVRHSA